MHFSNKFSKEDFEEIICYWNWILTTLDFQVTQMNTNCWIIRNRRWECQSGSSNKLTTCNMQVEIVGGAGASQTTHRLGWASYDFCVVFNCHSPPPSARQRLPLLPVWLSIDPSPVQIGSLLQIVKQRNRRGAMIIQLILSLSVLKTGKVLWYNPMWMTVGIFCV